MGKVHYKTYYHIVWSTYRRMPVINIEKMKVISNAVVRKCKELGCGVYALGGWNDHFHILITIPPKYSVSNVVKMLKGYTSRIVNKKFGSDGLFRWQRGYSVFTVSANRIGYVIKYISNQEKHRKNEDNKTEYRKS